MDARWTGPRDPVPRCPWRVLVWLDLGEVPHELRCALIAGHVAGHAASVWGVTAAPDLAGVCTFDLHDPRCTATEARHLALTWGALKKR